MSNAVMVATAANDAKRKQERKIAFVYILSHIVYAGYKEILKKKSKFYEPAL
jgi:hypothetical protein